MNDIIFAKVEKFINTKETKMKKFIFLLTIVMAASVSMAATITVTSTADSGAGSLRQAVADASAGDTVDFNLTYPATITLTSGDININKDLTITGFSWHHVHTIWYDGLL